MSESWTRGEYVVTDEPERIDAAFVHGYLSRSYWAEGIPLAVVEQAIENSLCFGVFGPDGQVGFARVITDYATFAYLADVFIIEEHRGRGLSVWLMECVAEHPRLQGLRRWLLGTRDAHTLYEKTGWSRIKPDDGRWMEKADPDVYERMAKGQMT